MPQKMTVRKRKALAVAKKRFAGARKSLGRGKCSGKCNGKCESRA